MSRYGPGVLPIARTTLAEALADGANAFMAMRATRRREGFEDAQNRRADAADTRANEFLGIQQGDARIRQQRAEWDREDRPLQQAVSLAGAYNAGVERTRPEDGMPDVPYDAIAVPGTNYFIRPDQTARGQAQQDRALSAQLRREGLAAGLESWLIRGQTARDIAAIRGNATVRAAGVRGMTAGATNRDANLRAMTANDRALLQALDNDIEDASEAVALDDQDTVAASRLASLQAQRSSLLANFEAGQQQLASTVGAPRTSRVPTPAAPRAGNAPTPETVARAAVVQEAMRERDKALARGMDPMRAQQLMTEYVRRRLAASGTP